MTTGTRNMINRLKQHMHETQDAIRRAKARWRTPFDQCPPSSGPTLLALKELASILCATRAEMRGRPHFKDPKFYLTAEERDRATPPTRTQAEWITKKLDHAATWESYYTDGTKHQTLPLWMRNTIKAALEAAKQEPARRTERQKRYLAHKAKQPAA